MGDKYVINETMFHEKLENEKEMADQLYVENALEHKDYACGNMTSLLILAKQQEYLVTVSNLYKEHVTKNVIEVNESCELRTSRTATALKESICYKEYQGMEID